MKSVIFEVEVSEFGIYFVRKGILSLNFVATCSMIKYNFNSTRFNFYPLLFSMPFIPLFDLLSLIGNLLWDHTLNFINN